MPTNLAIDDRLLNKALKIGHFKTKRETVVVALREFVEKREQKKILQAMGTFDFRSDWDYKKDRGDREHCG